MSLRGCGSIFVTGGRGLVGRHVIHDLLDHFNVKADQIHVLATSTKNIDKIGPVNYHEGDLANPSTIQSLLEEIRPVVIFHLASPRPFVNDLDYFLKVNVQGTQQLIEEAQKVGSTKAFVYCSSASVVHDSVSDLINADESLPLVFMPHQPEPYSHSKALGDKAVLEANNQSPSRMLTTSLRPAGIFGKGDEMLTKTWIENAKVGKTKYQIGDGKNLFDFTYAGDIARALVQAAEILLRDHENPSNIASDKKVDGEAFFITSAYSMPFWEFGRKLGAAAGYPTPQDQIKVISRSMGLRIAYVMEWMSWLAFWSTAPPAFTLQAVRYSTLTRTFSIDKARTRLGYKPLFSLEEAIARSVK